MRDTANVREYWQAGDADATAAFQRAADAALVVRVPPGTYDVNGAPVALRTGAQVNGLGMGAAIVKCSRPHGTSFSGIFTNADRAGGNADIALRDLTIWRSFEVPGASTFDELAFFKYVDRLTVERVRFLGTLTEPWHAGKGLHLSGCRWAKVRDSFLEDIPDNPLCFNDFQTTGRALGYHDVRDTHFLRSVDHVASLLIADQGELSVEGCTFQGFSDTALSVANAIETGKNAAGAKNTGLTFANNVVVGLGADIGSFDGVVIVGNRVRAGRLGVNEGTGVPTTDALVSGNVVLGLGIVGTGLKLTRVDRVHVGGNVVRGGDVGIYLSECLNPEVLANLVTACRLDGIRIAGSSARVRALDNRCYDNGQAGTGDDYGLLVDGAGVDSIIARNIASDLQTTPTQKYGIGVNGGTALTLVGNVAKGNAHSAYREIIAPNYVKRRGNAWNGVTDF